MMTQQPETRPDTAMEVTQANAEVMIAQLATWAQIKTGNTEQATDVSSASAFQKTSQKSWTGKSAKAGQMAVQLPSLD